MISEEDIKKLRDKWNQLPKDKPDNKKGKKNNRTKNDKQKRERNSKYRGNNANSK